MCVMKTLAAQNVLLLGEIKQEVLLSALNEYDYDRRNAASREEAPTNLFCGSYRMRPHTKWGRTYTKT